MAMNDSQHSSNSNVDVTLYLYEEEGVLSVRCPGGHLLLRREIRIKQLVALILAVQDMGQRVGDTEMYAELVEGDLIAVHDPMGGCIRIGPKEAIEVCSKVEKTLEERRPW